MAKSDRSYWVISPNVNFDENNVELWRQASVEHTAAFMGYSTDDPKHRSGRKFAGKVPDGIQPGDVILIARRNRRNPDVVGFGVVVGRAKKRLRGFSPPGHLGSFRRLRPFQPWNKLRDDVPVDAAINHTQALVKLKPEENPKHGEICRWMDERLFGRSKSKSQRRTHGLAAPVRKRASRGKIVVQSGVRIVSSPYNRQLDYAIQTVRVVKMAQKREARLLDRYRLWLEKKDRALASVRYQALQCDGYEEAKQNLIEAKSSASREHIRMAVGQLLDYAYQGKTRLREPKKAVLLPKKPTKDSLKNNIAVDVKESHCVDDPLMPH